MAKVVKFFTNTAGLFLLLLLCSQGVAAGASAGSQNAEHKQEDTSKVICNVVMFAQKLGLPIMTGVILGSSVMAIFGRLAWPAIAMLIVFTAIFFGSSKIIGKFADGVGGVKGNDFDCKTVSSQQ